MDPRNFAAASTNTNGASQSVNNDLHNIFTTSNENSSASNVK